MAAEGGTGPNHSEVIFTSASPFGPFKPCAITPILTQRGLPGDRPNPVTCVGHADLVETPDGDWYAVFLGVRPYRNGHDVMGKTLILAAFPELYAILTVAATYLIATLDGVNLF